jgi:hypothetical protein
MRPVQFREGSRWKSDRLLTPGNANAEQLKKHVESVGL